MFAGMTEAEPEMTEPEAGNGGIGARNDAGLARTTSTQPPLPQQPILSILTNPSNPSSKARRIGVLCRTLDSRVRGNDGGEGGNDGMFAEMTEPVPGMTEAKAEMTQSLRGRHQRNHPSHNNPSFPSLPILQILVQKRVGSACLAVLWIPASAGMTEAKAGMTESKPGMTGCLRE